MSEINVDPMKKSSIYATFGRYYGEKLYKLLYDCCSGRPGSFCYEVLSCLGISSQGDSSKFLNQQGNWEYVSGSEPIEVIYTELINLISTNSLIPGKQYLITDFKTVHYIQFSGGGIGSEDIHTGTTEPMVVQAVSNSELAAEIWSTVYPEDEITWKPIFVDREWDAVLGQSTGIITSRYDTINCLYRDFDWRNVIFRRWETVNGSGIYDSYLPTAFAFQDYPPFPNGSFKATIGSPLIVAPVLGAPYQLDNLVSQTICAEIDIHTAYANNFLGVFFSNIIQICAYNTSNNFNFNLGTAFTENVVADILFNRCSELVTNTATEISDNCVGFLGDNSVADKITQNVSTSISDNISTIPNSSIVGNNVTYIQNNVDFEFISENTGNKIDSNTRCNITENICRAISANIHQTIGQFMIIDSNTCEAILTNNSNSAGDLLIGSNSLSSIADNTFEDVSEFFQNNGTVFNDNSFAVGGGTTFRYNVFGNLENNTINVRGVNKNTFNANISGKVFTPTVSMDSAMPSLTLYDTALADVEQILTAGVLSYTPF